jgi:hypothetical protein
VESVVPEAVQLIDGILHVDYESLIPYLSESIKQNFNDINDLRSKTDRIQQTIDSMYEQFVKREDLKATGVVEDSRRKDTKRSSSGKNGLSTLWKIIIIATITATCATIGLVTYLVVTSQGQSPIDNTPSAPSTPSTPSLPVSAPVAPVGEEHSPVFRALQVLYEATNGQNWQKRDGWLDPSVTVCKWYGVKCKNAVPVELQLASNNLVGTVPDTLSDLGNLISIDFTNNTLEGPLPSVLLELKEMATMKLGGNKFSGTISVGWTRTSLVLLDLSNNELSGTVPDMGIQLAMVELNLSRNRFVGTIPAFVISRLDLSHNLLEGTLPSLSWSMKYLNLANNSNLFGNLTEISDMQAIEALDLSFNNFNDTLELTKAQLHSLRVLDISHTQIKHLAQKEKEEITPDFNECDASNTPFVCPLPDWASRCKATCQ